MENVGFHYLLSFEKLKPNWSQTWVTDTTGFPLHVNEIKSHVPRSRVIQGQVRWKLKFV